MDAASIHTSTRMMLMNIDALGMSVRSSTLRITRASPLVINSAATIATSRKMIFPAFASNHCSI